MASFLAVLFGLAIAVGCTAVVVKVVLAVVAAMGFWPAVAALMTIQGAGNYLLTWCASDANPP